MNDPTTLTPAQVRTQRVHRILNAAWDDHQESAISANDLRAVVYSCLYFGRFRRWPSGLEYNLQDRYSIAPELGRVNYKWLESLHEVAFRNLWTPAETGRAAQSECIWDFPTGKPKDTTFADFVRRLVANRYDAVFAERWQEKKRIEDWSDTDDPTFEVSEVVLPPAETTPLLVPITTALEDCCPLALTQVKLAEQRYRQRFPAVAKHHLNGVRVAYQVADLIRKNGDLSHVTGREAIGKHMAQFDREMVSISAKAFRESGEIDGLDWDEERKLTIAKLGLSVSKSKSKGVNPARQRRVIEREPEPEQSATTATRPKPPSPTSVAAAMAAANAEAKGEREPTSDQVPLVLPVVFADLTLDAQFSWTWELALAGDRRTSVGKNHLWDEVAEDEEEVWS